MIIRIIIKAKRSTTIPKSVPATLKSDLIIFICKILAGYLQNQGKNMTVFFAKKRLYL